MVPLTMSLAMPIPMSMMVIQEEMLVRAVPGKRNGSDPKTREQPLEAIEAAKRAIVSPCFTICVSIAPSPHPGGDSLPGPGILPSVDRPRRRRGLEFGDAEAGGVVYRHVEVFRHGSNRQTDLQQTDLDTDTDPREFKTALNVVPAVKEMKRR